MRWALFLILLCPLEAEACIKEVKVLVYSQKMLPSLLDFSKKKIVKGQKTVSIDCKLYDEIKVGDILVDKNADPEIDIQGSIFNTPLEEVKYEVISK